MSQSKRQQAREQARAASQNALWLMIAGGGVLILAAVILAYSQYSGKIQGNVSSGEDYVSAQPVSVDVRAPNVELTDLQGNSVSFADYAGQVILYNAWATWCPPCKQEMPTLQAYYEAHKDEGFVIIAIEDGEPVEEVRQFVADYGLTFPVWPDPNYVATSAFLTDSLPTSFVIDRAGTARLTWTGAISRAMLEKYVTPLLKP